MTKLHHTHDLHWGDDYPIERARAHLDAAHDIVMGREPGVGHLDGLRDRHERAHRDGEFADVWDNQDIPLDAIDDRPPPDLFPQPLPLAQRKELIATLPWVARFPHGTSGGCQAIKSTAPMRAWRIFRQEHDGVLSGFPSEDELASIAKYRCKRVAHYLYIEVDGRTRRLCYTHTSDLLSWSLDEQERYQKWTTAHPLEQA